ncbi:MAG: helix-turn-helix domain-containing protein [Dorea sp.]
MEWIDHFAKLNSVEQRLKTYYHMYPERHLDLPCEQADVEDLVERAFLHSETQEKGFSENDRSTFKNEISEVTFIRENMDISFVRHMRYTPAFWHKHEFFELLCILRGSCKNIFSNREFVMQTGDICIHAPGTIHTVSAFHDDDILINILIRKSTFEKEFMGLMEGNSILSSFFNRIFYKTVNIPYLLFHTGDAPELVTLIGKAYLEEASRHRYQKQMVNALISQFFILLLQNYEHSIEIPTIKFDEEDVKLMYILRYMQSNYKTISLKELAEFFHYSERQLQRIIIAATGMTFRDNIQKQKMEQAAYLLQISELSISEICEQTGYTSPNNFRKIFSKYYGTTPSEYRKQYKK